MTSQLTRSRGTAGGKTLAESSETSESELASKATPLNDVQKSVMVYQTVDHPS